ncbi:hypothetical protein F5Y15DRAFT_43155 [Xylariaceae sp. FL0016]|nr:hypothetical protein F5Y15DRAFT_43155 [Xylariaceae sp. FL0016]
MFTSRQLVAALAGCVQAAVLIHDPSDVISSADYTADNSIVPDYNVGMPAVQPEDLQASYYVAGESKSWNHTTLSASENDTSVVLVSDGGDLTLSHVDILKTGYSSNLNWASFWGFNAAINVANASTAVLDHVNLTVHSGAAGVYSYGDNTVVNVTDLWAYSSGPVSHCLYASGNGTIHARNVNTYSGGYRSSAFSGDIPSGDLYISDSVAHVAGIGSAVFYTLGLIVADNVVGVSEQGPVVFMDSNQIANLTNVQGTAGLLGGVAIFSSSARTSGAQLHLKDSSINATGETMPGLWFGNTIIDVTIASSDIISTSGVMISANTSQITQDFDTYADYSVNSAIEPAEVYTVVSESSLQGDLVAYNHSLISFSLTEHSNWVGSAYSGYGVANFDISLDATSNWTLTADTTVQNLTNADASMANINSNGFSLYYNSSAIDSAWLNGSTIELAGGGSVQPTV